MWSEVFNKGTEWYAVSTYSRHEKKVSEALLQKSIDAFLPLYRETRQWRNRTKATVESPLFPGYVFVRTSLDSRIEVLRTPGIARFVGFGGDPTPISELVIEKLRLGLSKVDAKPCPYLKIGESVRVISGPLSGLQGVVVEMRNQSRFVLSLDLLAQSISVEIDRDNLEPIPTAGGR